MSSEEENCRIFSVCRPDSRSEFEYYITKFAASHNVDFTNCPGGAKIERENNLKEFKSAYDIDSMPKSGAGSEYGREHREEARRKKYGIRTKNYNPNDQPFILKLGAGKQQKRLKGTKNGGVSKNTNYVAFALIGNTKFVSLPVGDWYDFTPMPKYKALNAEEAEEQFSRRDKTFNHFAIMCSKKYNKDKDDEEGEKETKSGRGSKKKGSLMLTEFELMSGSEEEDSENEEPKEEEVTKKKGRKGKKRARDDVHEEAKEESDEIDEGQELDYLSMSSSDDEDMYDDDARDGNDIYNDMGVAEEEGLRTLGSDDDEDEEEDDDKKDDEEDDDEKGKDSDSGSDSDIESDMLFDMPSSKASSSNKSPTGSEDIKKDSMADKKRKSDSPENRSKKPKFDSTSSAKPESSIEEIVKKYLLRKPSTTIDLLKKLTSKQSLLNSYSKDEIQSILFNVMRKLKLEKKTIGGNTYFFLLENNKG